MTVYMPGDIFLTRGDSFVSKAIRFFSRSGGEARTMVNHCGLVVEGGELYGGAMIVEASTRVIRRRFRAYAGSESTMVAVYRPVNVTAEQVSTIVDRANGYVGAKYGYVKIVAHFVDWCLGGRYVARRVTGMDRYPICSWVVAQAYADAGLTFDVPAGSADPDDVWDYVVTSDNYRAVHPLGYLR